MVILDKMILTRRLYEFVQEFVRIRNEELEDQTRWEYWLHKVFDLSFADFLARAEGREEKDEKPSEQELEATVKNSMEIITGIRPS